MLRGSTQAYPHHPPFDTWYRSFHSVLLGAVGVSRSTASPYTWRLFVAPSTSLLWTGFLYPLLKGGTYPYVSRTQYVLEVTMACRTAHEYVPEFH